VRLTNKTNWRSDHIRAFVQRCLEAEMEPHQRKKIRVLVKYRRQYGSGGRAYLGHSQRMHATHMTLYLPKEGAQDKIALAHTIVHEIGHLQGLQHRDMQSNPGVSRKYMYGVGYQELYKWAEELPLEREAEVEPVKPSSLDKFKKKLEAAEKKLAKAEKREKAAIKLRKKWEAKVKYYGKKVS
jgi:hypothetical protein